MPAALQGPKAAVCRTEFLSQELGGFCCIDNNFFLVGEAKQDTRVEQSVKHRSDLFLSAANFVKSL